MGGGPTDQQKQAATGTLNAAKGAQATADSMNAVTQPFYTGETKEGTPYYTNQTDAVGGNTAKAFAPVRAQLNRKIGAQPGLPSGFKTGANADVDEAQAQQFDSGLLNAQREKFAAQNQGAQGLNPLGWEGMAMGGNQSVMNANLRSPGAMGLLGGVAGGLASAIPF